MKDLMLSKKKIIIIASIAGFAVTGLSLGIGHFAYKANHASTAEITVNFVTNGGSYVEPIRLHVGQKLDKNKIITTRDNEFTFLGWFTDKELTKQFSFDTVINNSMTLYAKWNLNETTEGLVYEINSNNTGYIVSSNNGLLPKNVKVPEQYNGLPITEIKSDGFKDTNIKSIELPNSLNVINDNAFNGCILLNSVKTGDNLTYIGAKSFEGCSTLKEINFSKSLSFLGDGSFKDCISLVDVSLPNELDVISKDAFNNCRSLQNLSLGKNITVLYDGTFSNCISLNEVTFPTSLTDIASGAFLGSKISKIILEDLDSSWKVLYENTPIPLDQLPEKLNNGIAVFKAPFYQDITNGLAFYKKGKNKSGNDTVGIGYSDEFSTLKTPNITIPSQINVQGKDYIVDEITNGAFDKKEHSFITGLVSITIPNTITQIKRYAFRDCSGLTTVNFANDSKLEIISDYAFEGCSSLGSINLPKSLNGIGNCAFHKTNLTTINLPENLSEIKYGLEGSINVFPFAYISSLTSITVDTSNKYFGSSNNGLYLKSENKFDELIFLPFGLTGDFAINSDATKILHSALQGSKISSITLGEKIANDNNLYKCFLDIENDSNPLTLSNLTEIKVSVNNPNYSASNGVLFNKNQKKLIKYPTYKTDSSYALPTSIEEIEQYAFYKNTSITEVTSSNLENMQSIKHHAFDGCTQLSKLFNEENKIYKSADSINLGEYALNGIKITKLYIGSDISYNDYCFNIPSLTEVIIDVEGIANLLEEVSPEGGKTCLYDSATDVYVKNDITISPTSYLGKNFTKQGTSSKANYNYYKKST